MFMKTLGYFVLPLLLLLSNSSGISASQDSGKSSQGASGTAEKMIVSTGNVTMDLDVSRFNGIRSEGQELRPETFRFEIGPNSFFSLRVINNSLRGPAVGRA